MNQISWEIRDCDTTKYKEIFHNYQNNIKECIPSP